MMGTENIQFSFITNCLSQQDWHLDPPPSLSNILPDRSEFCGKYFCGDVLLECFAWYTVLMKKQVRRNLVTALADFDHIRVRLPRKI